MGVMIDRFDVGPLQTNAFVVSDEEKNALIIDAPPQSAKIIDFLKLHRLNPIAILLTHAHFDHCMGITEIHEAFGTVPVYIQPNEKILLRNPDYNGSVMLGFSFVYHGATEDLKQGETSVGEFSFMVLEVYGHSPGGCAFLFENSCIVGDTLFAGSVGRTDFPGCDGTALLKNISEKIFTLPGNTIIYPGHGKSTTVEKEKKSNPFFR
ncbi:MAG: MBL fold metallo-hydrolase [Fibrobacterota bacterium]